LSHPWALARLGSLRPSSTSSGVGEPQHVQQARGLSSTAPTCRGTTQGDLCPVPHQSPGVLLWKREAEKALESSGMRYTIVRPGKDAEQLQLMAWRSHPAPVQGSNTTCTTDVATSALMPAGGMERPTDSYKKTHNLVLSKRDTTFGGQVSRLQVCPTCLHIGPSARQPHNWACRQRQGCRDNSMTGSQQSGAQQLQGASRFQRWQVLM
jgi:hypothetical protein